MRRFAVAAVWLAAGFAGGPVGASVVSPPAFDALVAGAGEIFLGEVVERASRIVQRGDRRLIVTDVTFRTLEVIRGAPDARKTLTFLGGTVGDVHMEAQGMPTFLVGDRDVLFVRPEGARSLIPLVAMFHGRFRVVAGRNGTGEFVANHARQPLESVARYHAPARLDARVSPLPLADFLATVRQLAGAR